MSDRNFWNQMLDDPENFSKHVIRSIMDKVADEAVNLIIEEQIKPKLKEMVEDKLSKLEMHMHKSIDMNGFQWEVVGRWLDGEKNEPMLLTEKQK